MLICIYVMIYTYSYHELSILERKLQLFHFSMRWLHSGIRKKNMCVIFPHSLSLQLLWSIPRDFVDKILLLLQFLLIRSMQKNSRKPTKWSLNIFQFLFRSFIYFNTHITIRWKKITKRNIFLNQTYLGKSN